MHPLRLVTGLVLLLASVTLTAQERAPTYVQLTYANDYFTATDYYYTQGIRLEYGRGLHVYGIGQEGYTPTSIRADQILYGDRPYAGALYLIYGTRAAAARGSSGRNRLQWASEILAGVMGPASLAAAEQKWIHRQTGNIPPMGWEYQIANDLLLDYRLLATRTFLSSRWLEWSVSGEGRLGTYRSRIGLQSDLHLGWLPDRRSRSGISLHLRPAARMVGYDATLQGGVFNRSSPYTLRAKAVARLVGEVQAGVEVKLGGFLIDFSHTYLTREFRPGRGHAWGTVRLRTTY